jgi:energy-coupling factor transport system ATP-binding protein
METPVIPTEEIIKVSNLSFGYTSQHLIIKDSSFEINKGEIVAISGPSGIGKTTLAYILKGLIPHSIKGVLSGDIVVAGQNLYKTNIAQLARYVGMVFQDLNTQLFSATVLEEIQFGLRNMHLDLSLADDALERLSLTDLKGQIPMNLSAGQKQRVVIASVIAPLPQILILDEPSAHLDPPAKILLIKWLKELNSELNTTILVIDQDPNFIGDLCTSALLIKENRIIRVAKEDVLTQQMGWSWTYWRL